MQISCRTKTAWKVENRWKWLNQCVWADTGYRNVIPKCNRTFNHRTYNWNLVLRDKIQNQSIHSTTKKRHLAMHLGFIVHKWETRLREQDLSTVTCFGQWTSIHRSSVSFASTSRRFGFYEGPNQTWHSKLINKPEGDKAEAYQVSFFSQKCFQYGMTLKDTCVVGLDSPQCSLQNLNAAWKPTEVVPFARLATILRKYLARYGSATSTSRPLQRVPT